MAKEKTMAGLWTKLECLYMTKSRANKLYIKKRMFTLTIMERSSLEDHTDKFNKVCDILKAIDVEGKALLLISSLPKSFENFGNVLVYVDKL